MHPIHQLHDAITMTKWERIFACIRGEETDRLPISFWVHYHLQDRSPHRLAQATAALHRRYDTDLIKLTPSGLYGVQDWGAAIRYWRDDWTPPVMNEPVVADGAAWKDLPELDVYDGALARELELIREVRAEVGPQVPVLMTVFSPLTLAWKLMGNAASSDRLQRDMKEHSQSFHTGLKAIAATTRRFAQASLDAGADGFFFATQAANFEVLSDQSQYEEFGLPYDLEVLNATRKATKVSILHLCKKQLMVDIVQKYPVDIFNWNHFSSGLGLREGKDRTGMAVAGGLDNQRLHHMTPEEVTQSVRDVHAQAGERGFLLAPTCVLDARTPEANLLAARKAVLHEAQFN